MAETAFGKHWTLLDLCDGYGLLIADLDTAFTSQALFSIHWDRLAIFHLENVHGADLDTFLTTFAFIRIHGYFISHFFVLLIG